MRRFAILLQLVFLTVMLTGCASSNKSSKDNTKNYKYFRIFADADDDPIFIKLQDEIGLDPKMERYIIVVNIQDNIPEKYILIGNVDDSNPVRFSWAQLSVEVRSGLINWSGSNKESLE